MGGLLGGLHGSRYEVVDEFVQFASEAVPLGESDVEADHVDFRVHDPDLRVRGAFLCDHEGEGAGRAAVHRGPL